MSGYQPPSQGEESPLDKRVSVALAQYSQYFSRRSFLATAGRVALALVGVTIAREILPVDRRVANAESCSDWELCGLYGRVCTCCNGGGGYDVCPSGSEWFSFWQACCPSPFLASYWVLYWDCCNCDSPGSCSGCMWCKNNDPQPAWCNGGTYCCTAPVIGSEC